MDVFCLHIGETQEKVQVWHENDPSLCKNTVVTEQRGKTENKDQPNSLPALMNYCLKCTNRTVVVCVSQTFIMYMILK